MDYHYIQLIFPRNKKKRSVKNQNNKSTLHQEDFVQIMQQLDVNDFLKRLIHVNMYIHFHNIMDYV